MEKILGEEQPEKYVLPIKISLFLLAIVQDIKENLFLSWKFTA
jgi:hypothetical protein